MSVNRDKLNRWKADIAASVDMYNEWFVEFAPAAYRRTRRRTTADVEAMLRATDNLARIDAPLLRKQPAVLSALRMSTCPPIAVDRLVGLAGVSSNLVWTMGKGRLPPRMSAENITSDLGRIAGNAKEDARSRHFRVAWPGEAAKQEGSVQGRHGGGGSSVRCSCEPNRTQCSREAPT